MLEGVVKYASSDEFSSGLHGAAVGSPFNQNHSGRLLFAIRTGWTLTDKTVLGLKTTIFCPDMSRQIFGWNIQTDTMIGIPFRIPMVTDKYGMMLS